ncbi:hypothetical protein E6O75_ATG09991 [Venturia nashicola]|uniref:Uncharacterized protein n=1 Tax=Venturia nashicola TaxID=86259 RepID=A0A4Z1NJT4_9PEZI|nr:hypothetical protein E6O75_ATG09991 [Venturia nashicola]
MASLAAFTRREADPQGKLFKMKTEMACKNDGSRYKEPPGRAKGHRVIATSTIMGNYEVIVCTITSKDQVPGIEFLPITPTVGSASYWQFPLQLRQSIDQYEATDLRPPSYLRLEPFKVPFEMLLPHTSSLGGHLSLSCSSIRSLCDKMGALGLIKPFYPEWEEKRKELEKQQKMEAEQVNLQYRNVQASMEKAKLERQSADPEAYRKMCEDQGMQWEDWADAMEEHGGFDCYYDFW